MESQAQYTATPPSYSPPQKQSTPDPTDGVAVEVTAPQQPAVVVQKVPSYVWHIIFACAVLWLCNLVFGLTAFIFAGQYILFSKSITININRLTKSVETSRKRQLSLTFRNEKLIVIQSVYLIA